MLNFFKRKPDGTATSRPATAPGRPRKLSGPGALPAEPPPLPEVTEGNLESDWAMWEDSVAFQDSQMPAGFNERASVRDRTQEYPNEQPDPYASVRNRGK